VDTQMFAEGLNRISQALADDRNEDS
jgi:hypothetical protein